MKPFVWDNEKDDWLKAKRGVSFKEAVEAIEKRLIKNISGTRKYPNQRIFIIELRGYIHAVPYLETEEAIELKTIYPSRSMNGKYRG